jgi:hypothetical protein
MCVTSVGPNPTEGAEPPSGLRSHLRDTLLTLNQPIDLPAERFELRALRSETQELSMKRRFIRSFKTERGKFAMLAVCIALPVCGGMFLCQLLLGKMLRDDAQNTSSAWVSMLLARNPDILTLLSGATPSVRTMQLLDEASQVGDIYRFRIWDPAGHVAFKSERATSAGEPIDRKRVAEVFASELIINDVHGGRPPQNVPFLGRAARCQFTEFSLQISSRNRISSASNSQTLQFGDCKSGSSLPRQAQKSSAQFGKFFEFWMSAIRTLDDPSPKNRL